MRRGKKGFTLIELIIVIVIIAILAGIAIPAVVGYVDDANKAKAISNVSLGTRTAITCMTLLDSQETAVSFAKSFEEHIGSKPSYVPHDAEVGLIIDKIKRPPIGYTIYTGKGTAPTAENPILLVVWYDGGGYYGKYDAATGEYTAYKL